jgi:hypothetical protein
MCPFAFSSEQDENLKRWSQYLDTDDAKSWQSDVSLAVIEYNRILEDAAFPNGTDLTSDQLDALFRHMKPLSHNRALNNLLYTDNTLPSFNESLRSLLFGSEPLPKRVDEFLDLSGMGEVSLPITLEFAKRVGDVLSELDPAEPTPDHYRFYM